MTNSVTVLALALTLGLSSGCKALADDQTNESDRDQVAMHVHLGERAASSGDWATAKKEFSAAIQTDPKCAVAFYDLGVAQAHLGELTDAVQSERQAVDIDPKFSDAYVELGWILSQLQQYDEAVVAEKKALEINPSNRAAARNLGAIATARKDAANGITPSLPAPAVAYAGGTTSKARPAKIAAAVISSSSSGSGWSEPISRQSPKVVADNYIAAGQAAYKKHDLEIAQKNFEQAIAVAPNHALAHQNLGVVLGSQGNFDGEITEENKAIALDGKNSAAMINLGWALAKKEKWAESLVAYQKALTLGGTNTQAQLGQALALFFVGKHEAGIAAARVAKLSAPRIAGPYIALGTMFARQGRVVEAESELRDAIRIAPTNVDAKQQLGTLMLENDKADQAIQVFGDMVAQAPSNAAGHAGLSLALELKGDTTGAEQSAKRALGLNPKLQLAQPTLDRLAQKKSRSAE